MKKIHNLTWQNLQKGAESHIWTLHWTSLTEASSPRTGVYFPAIWMLLPKLVHNLRPNFGVYVLVSCSNRFRLRYKCNDVIVGVPAHVFHCCPKKSIATNAVHGLYLHVRFVNFYYESRLWSTIISYDTMLVFQVECEYGRLQDFITTLGNIQIIHSYTGCGGDSWRCSSSWHVFKTEYFA